MTNATIEPDLLSLDEEARLGFVLEMRRRWSQQLFDRQRGEYEAATAAEPPATVEEAVDALQRLPTHPWFGWIERNIQKQKWRAVADVVDRHWDRIGRDGNGGEIGPSTLELNDDFALPDWYTGIDIHCQPGGVWADDQNAYVYELGARILHLGRNDQLELHELFTRTLFGDVEPGARIVDLGCGFAKSTRPFAARFPDAEVIGVDMAAPLLKLGWRRANEAGLRIRFLQADASDVPLPDQSCAVVTGTMVLHELPGDVLAATLTEAVRLLRPGGELRFLEFARTGDLYVDACLQEHAARNNEPFMPLLMDFPVVDVLEAAGATNVRWIPFDERGPGAVDEHPHATAWRFPWAVLAAERLP